MPFANVESLRRIWLMGCIRCGPPTLLDTALHSLRQVYCLWAIKLRALDDSVLYLQLPVCWTVFQVKSPFSWSVCAVVNETPYNVTNSTNSCKPDTPYKPL